MEKGVFNRFRTLPIARIAPLAGALMADTVRYVIATVITFAMGYLLGFRTWQRTARRHRGWPAGDLLCLVSELDIRVFW